jgi:hypothetical protein
MTKIYPRPSGTLGAAASYRPPPASYFAKATSQRVNAQCGHNYMPTPPSYGYGGYYVGPYASPWGYNWGNGYAYPALPPRALEASAKENTGCKVSESMISPSGGSQDQQQMVVPFSCSALSPDSTAVSSLRSPAAFDDEDTRICVVTVSFLAFGKSLIAQKGTEDYAEE